MPAVGGGIEDDVLGPALDAAFQHGLERLVGGVVAVEGEIVAEHDEMEGGRPQQVHQRGQALDVLAVDLDQLQPVGGLAVGIDAGMRSLHQRGLAHAARAPQQRIVGGQAVGEALGVLDQDVAHPVDALEQEEVDAADALDLGQPPVRVPDKGVGIIERFVRRGGRRVRRKVGRNGLQRADDPHWRVGLPRALWGVLPRLSLPFALTPWKLAATRFYGVFSTCLKFLTAQPYRALTG